MSPPPPNDREEMTIPRLSPALRTAIAGRIAARDLPGALATARDAAAGEPGRTEMIVALARLVAATERLDHEAPVPSKGTVPLDGHGFVLFQLRMGNLGDAERALRQIVVDRANDHLAQERLRDVILVRSAIESGAGASEPPAAPAGWLDKRKARPTGEGWAPVVKDPAPSPPGGWEEVETNVLRPEQEAELLLRSGQPLRALETYRRVLARDPGRAQIAARVREIEALLEEGRAPIPGEATVQRDVRALADSRDARPSRAVAPEPAIEGELPAIADDDPTLFGRRPAGLAAPDPLAATPPPEGPRSPAGTANVAVHRIVRVG